MRIDEAVGMYEKAAGLNPHSAALNSRLARAYWIKSGGQDNEYRRKAIRQMETAVSRYGVRSAYRIQLGRMYHLSGMADEAVRQYELAKEYESAEFFIQRKKLLRKELEQVEKWLEELRRDGNRTWQRRNE